MSNIIVRTILNGIFEDECHIYKWKPADDDYYAGLFIEKIRKQERRSL